MKITTAGVITRVADFPQHVVTTGIAATGSGPFYVGALGTFPFAPADGRVYSVGDPTGNITQVASGYSSVTDVEFGPGGALYALTFGDQATDPNSPAPWSLNSGKILKVNTSTGQMSVDRRWLHLHNERHLLWRHGVRLQRRRLDPRPGRWPDLEDCELLDRDPAGPVPTAAPTTAAPAPTPTAAASGAITAPNTGSGGQAGASGDSGYLTLVLLGLAGAAIVATGTGILWKRSQ